MRKKRAATEEEALVIEMWEARKARGESQLDVARALGVTSNTITFWETGKTSPTRRNRARIAKWLKGENFAEPGRGPGAFGRKIKKMRFDRRLTLSEFSRSIGISVSTIHNWESGVAMPSEIHLRDLRDWEGDNRLIKE